jgi:hypothetical protein
MDSEQSTDRATLIWGRPFLIMLANQESLCYTTMCRGNETRAYYTEHFQYERRNVKC